MVPKGWVKVSLDQLAEVRTGVAKGKTGLKDPITVPYLRVANVQDGRIDLSEIKEIEIEREKLERYSLKYGDVLMNEGGDFDKLGRGDVWLNQIEPCLHQNHVFAVRPQQEKLNSFYLAALAAGYYGKKYFLSCAKRSTNLASINSSQIKEFPVLVPPISEQQEIVQILSTWDQAISATEKLLENSQQQKKALMQQLLTGKKRLLDENGVRFSEGWTICMLEELEQRGWAELSRGKVISKVDIQEIPGDYPIYSSSVKNNGLMGYYGEYMFDEELISWSVDGGGDFFYRPKHKFSITNVSGYMRLDTAKLCYQFIANQLQLLHSKLEFDYQSKAHPSVIRKLYKLSIPSIEEQKKIAEVLSLADQEIETLQKKLDYLKQEKKALMQQLLTGKKRVKVAT